MITGDHPLTAQYTAGELDIDADSRVLSGRELERMSQEDLDANDISTYARVARENKLHIVESSQRSGHIAAMTGVGVNDTHRFPRRPTPA